MACFRLSYSGYNMEVMILIRYGYDTTVFLLLLIDIVACDLYFVLNYYSYITYSYQLY